MKTLAIIIILLMLANIVVVIVFFSKENQLKLHRQALSEFFSSNEFVIIE